MIKLTHQSFEMTTATSIKPIRNEADYNLALQRMETIMDAPIGTPEGDEAEVLAMLIDAYEQEYYPIEQPDPIEAIKTRIEDLNLKQQDLVGIIGSKSRVSEVLHRKRRLTLDMIRKLNELLQLPIALLAQEYPLAVDGPQVALAMEPTPEYQTK